MRSRLRRAAAFGLPALSLCLLAACSDHGGGEGGAPLQAPPAPEAAPEPGGTIVRGSIGDASTLLPPLASDSASFDIADLVYSGLVRYGRDLEVEGDLAESWEVSPGGLEITFHLRRGVRWHDGEPFTAADAAFTWRLMTDAKTPTAYAESFLQAKEVETPDPYTFRVHYDEPFAPALVSWGFPVMPRHLLEGRDVTESELGRRPVGTGPYRFVKWLTGEKIVLEANGDYFGGRPLIDRYVYRVIPDSATMFLELKSGGIDWMNLDPLQYARQTETPVFRDHYRAYRYLDFQYTYLGFNLRDPRFGDRRVRRAIAHAIDKQEVVDIVLMGLGTAVTGPYKPGTWAWNDDVKRYPFDPPRARELLAEAGWRDGDGDGLVERDGAPFAFTIVTNQGNRRRAQCAEIIQGRLRDVGIDVSIRVIEWAAFLKEFVHPRKFEAIILGWRTDPDPDIYDVWHSSKTGPGELNHVSFASEEVDALLEEGRRSFDRETRRRAYFRIQEILAEEQPYVFLFAPESLPAIHARFRGIEPGPAGITYNFREWWVPPAERKYAP